MGREVFAAVPVKTEACRAGAFGVIEQCGARLIDRGLGKVAGEGKP
jgi:hypothetical protein